MLKRLQKLRNPIIAIGSIVAASLSGYHYFINPPKQKLQVTETPKTIENKFVSAIPTVSSPFQSQVRSLPQIPNYKQSQIDRIVNKGVSHYSSCSVVDIYRGLSTEGLRKYLKISVKEHEIPKTYEEIYLQFGENVVNDSDQNDYRRNVMFNRGSGSCIWVSLMCSRDESNDYNLFVTSLDIDCEVGEEMFVYEDYKGPNVFNTPSNIDHVQNLHSSLLSRAEMKTLFNFLNEVSQSQVSKGKPKNE